MIPSGRLWLILCLLALPTMAAGFITGLGPLILLLDALLLLVALADFALARRAPLKIWRELPVRLQVGVPNPVTLHLVNTAGRAIRLDVRDDSPQEFDSKPAVLSVTI